MPEKQNERNRNLQSSEPLVCPTCKGSGRVIVGHGVVCTELIERTAKCADCRGKGYLNRRDLPGEF